MTTQKHHIPCKICGTQSRLAFFAQILHTFNEPFYKCQNCGFLSCDDAHWLPQAYKSAINITDTGIVARNLYLYKIVSCVAAIFFAMAKSEILTGGGGIRETSLIDFGGGSGLLVRLLRDVGIESYWSDEYCDNLFARGFEWQKDRKPTLATCFEVFEHLPNPREQIDSMLQICPNLLFSTELLPCPIPESSGANAWWYYGFSHGQHISFYTYKSLEFIAKAHNLHFCSYGGLHLFSQSPISPLYFKWVIKLAHRGLFKILKKRFISKTMSDCERLNQMGL